MKVAKLMKLEKIYPKSNNTIAKLNVSGDDRKLKIYFI